MEDEDVFDVMTCLTSCKIHPHPSLEPSVTYERITISVKVEYQ